MTDRKKEPPRKIAKHLAGSSEKSTMQTNIGVSRKDRGTMGYQGKHRADPPR